MKKTKTKKDLIEKLWHIRRNGKFSDFNENELYTEKELKILNS
jgi:hypothetical protein